MRTNDTTNKEVALAFEKKILGVTSHGVYVQLLEKVSAKMGERKTGRYPMGDKSISMLKDLSDGCLRNNADLGFLIDVPKLKQ